LRENNKVVIVQIRAIQVTPQCPPGPPNQTLFYWRCWPQQVTNILHTFQSVEIVRKNT
jgi:hypothetical protein